MPSLAAMHDALGLSQTLAQYQADKVRLLLQLPPHLHTAQEVPLP